MPDGATRHECCNCGVVWWITDYMQACRLKDAQSFYCPNGHPQSYGKSEADKLRAQLDATRRERDQLKQNEAWYEDISRQKSEELAAAKKAHAVTKRKLTVTRKRVGNGVCPCCNRTVSQLARHMASKHPGFQTEAVQ
jgi:predicted nucleotide-binding protein